MIGASIGIASLVAFLVAGVPMIAALMIAVTISIVLGSQWGLVLPQNMVAGMSSYTLISFPLFVLGGIYMNAGGISGKLFNFARSLVGWMKGGLAQVDVLTSIFFGGMVGSSTADLAGSASILIPEMKKEGYSAPFAAAVSASSAGVGPLIPPSSPAILYSAVTGTSLGALFLAGLIPGVILGILFMITVGYLAHKNGYPTFGRFSLAEIRRAALSASLAFGMPGIIVGGLVLGIFTPSEAGAFGAVYAAFLALFVYRSIDWMGLYRATVAAVQLSGELLLIVSLSAALGSVLSAAHIPATLASFIDVLAIGDSLFLRLCALMVIAIIAGMFLDPLIPVLVPVLLPTLIAFDIDLLHFGVLMVMAVVIGQVTPPVAMSLIIAGRIAKCDQLKVFRANMPFFIVTLAFTLVLMAVPELATWLPSVARD
ncbi:C4-dicarboxylate ABC transporter permease [Aminobacter sp. DSM 101952]|uniref:TRAP transporter large permease n=1 Tax=Aminobacter sp. DSM 101952 TaxID=2735891 RepID=UPI0006FB6C6A|nr:TRAP transporter large permease [Aminobacter sp. DSM 101952]KQU73722.1 C4-dicarboxylate ABC transporter permease [Aminobacter sp. DSM 101952]